MTDRVIDGRHLLHLTLDNVSITHTVARRKLDALRTQAEAHGDEVITAMQHLELMPNTPNTPQWITHFEIRLVIAARAAFHFARLFTIYSNGGI